MNRQYEARISRFKLNVLRYNNYSKNRVMDYIVKLQKSEEIAIFIDLNIIKEDIKLLVAMYSKLYTRDVTIH